MGALHAGHASLIDVARSRAADVVVSIFVNPTQFAPNEDFSRYPRTLEPDLALCEAHGATLVFAPEPAEMYDATSPAAVVSMPSLSNVFEGAIRPGHFDGVCTVVSKLFHLVQPTFACFGEKDFQQLTVLRAMVASLNFPIEIIGCPTRRDVDGLAMSSRNRYLSADERARALSLSRALNEGRRRFAAGERSAAVLRSAMRATLEAGLAGGEHRIDYAALVDPTTLTEVETASANTRAIVTAKVGTTRLIDNLPLG